MSLLDRLFAAQLQGPESQPAVDAPSAAMGPFAHMLQDERVLALLGTLGIPYWWGHGDPATVFPGPAYDCSGYAQGALVYLDLLSPQEPDRGALVLSSLCSHVEDEPKLGDLAFYDNPVSHVMVCLGGPWVIGATGGGSHTHGDDPSACVKLELLRYRKDLKMVGRLEPGHV
jgi:hypothetical protein